MRPGKWLLFLFCFSRLCAQVNTAFIEHLSANNLRREHRAYLNSLDVRKDSTIYFEAKFHLKYFNDSLFLNSYAACGQRCLADSGMNIQAGRLLLLSNNSGTCTRWFTQVNVRESSAGEAWMQRIYKASLNPNQYSTDVFPDELRRSFNSYRKAYNKKPLLGATLSAIVPGLGKVYAGKARSGLLTFFLNAGYAAQTIESGVKLGAGNAFTIVNATIFTVFYLANVYGGYADIVTLKKERKKQFVNDAANFYN